MDNRELSTVARELSLEGFGKAGGKSYARHLALARLRELGTEVWLDTGDVEAAGALWRREVSACTTNNTLVNQVIQSGRLDADIKRIAGVLNAKFQGMRVENLVGEVGFILNCRVALGLVGEFACKVSVEVHPDVAGDVEGTVYWARRYHEVNPESFYVKVPLTPAGYVAARRLSDAGVPVNFTIAFSARQNYLAAMLSRPAFSNVFLGRNNQVVKENALGSGAYVGEKATLAAQQAVREVREAQPACRTRLIAASMRSGQQVYDLAGVDVMTVPPRAMEEFFRTSPLPSYMHNRLDSEYEMGVERDMERLDVLWEITDDFKRYAHALAALEPGRLGPDALVERAAAAGLGFLRRFGAEEIARIAARGKIPNLSDWPPEVALDDLMTESALQSFAADQSALDSRIRSLL